LGDGGSTGLLNGEQVPKDHPRIECLGTLDELTSFLGDAKRHAAHEHTRKIIGLIQEEIGTLMGILASPDSPAQSAPLAPGAPMPDESRLTSWIRELEARHPMRGFVVPGANPSQAKLHIARTVCRRAERRIVTLTRTAPVNPAVLRYINRLSDLLFMLSRYEEEA
jgi:ATP:cob(I)alamin adenosyltransferase